MIHKKNRARHHFVNRANIKIGGDYYEENDNRFNEEGIWRLALEMRLRKDIWLVAVYELYQTL